MEPFVHTIITPWANYVYDVSTNTILKVNSETIKWIYNKQRDNLNISTNKELHNLISHGYLKSNPITNICHPYYNIVQGYLENNISNITLQISQGCNFFCRYCSFAGKGVLDRVHANINMSWAVAKKSLDFFITHSSYAKTLYISFYGGEPLLNFDIIYKCVKYLKEQHLNKDIQFYMTTNASLLNEKNCDFLEKNNFHLLVSFDGPPEAQNKNRKLASNGAGSYNIVYEKLKYISENHPILMNNIELNAVIDPEIPSSIIYDYFKNDYLIKNFKYQFSNLDQSKIDLSYYLDDKKRKEDSFEKLKCLLLLGDKINSKINDNTITSRFTILQNNLKNKSRLPPTFSPRGQCIIGYKKLFVDVYGKLWPCEKISTISDDLCIGDLDNGFNYDKINELLNFSRRFGERCKNCWCIRLCNICISVLNTSRNLCGSNNEEICISTRKEIEEELLELIVSAEIHKGTLKI